MKAPDHPLPQATLQQLGTQPTNPQPVGDPIQVQFNPTTLRLSMQNSVDMKKAFGKRPATQYDGTSSSTLTFDLIFDCADEGTSAAPVDVRTRVAPIEKFLLPAAGQKKSIPPRVQFTYGTFQLIGVMTALNSEYDLFAASGVPLRAKLNVTIKEQLPEYEEGAIGSGANTGAGARDSQGLIPPGGGSPSAPGQTGTALGGESAPDFANRMGLDPAAWKGLDLGGLDPFSLTAGVAIDFSASLTVDLGFTAGISVGRSDGTPLFGGATPPSATAVTAAGGLQKALDSDARLVADGAAATARAGFPGAGSQASASAAPSRPATQSPLPTVANPGGLTFGFGVPLRSTIEVPDPFGTLPGARPAGTAGSLGGFGSVDPAGTVGDVPTTDDPTVPGWVALPRQRVAGTGSGSGNCGCGGGCGGSCAGCTGSAGRSAGYRARSVIPSVQGRPASLAVKVRPPRVRTAGHGGCGGCRGCS